MRGSGGARRGSGRPPSPAHTVRNERISVLVTAQDRADLEACAVAWDSPTATVAAFLLMEALANLRGEALALPEGSALIQTARRAASYLRSRDGSS